jgi:signal transduction histidine kinase
MRDWLLDLLDKTAYFMPHGHCYLWIPTILWMHVASDLLIGAAYVGISLVLYLLVRRIRLPFSPVFIAFGLFIGLCGMTHFMGIWTVWYPDYLLDGVVKVATALASVATAIGLVLIRPRIEDFANTARLSEQRRVELEHAHAELEVLYRQAQEADQARRRFYATVSHELRTPLSLILGPVEQVLQAPNLALEQRHLLQAAQRNSHSLLGKVNDLLDIAKLEAGGMPVRYRQVELVSWLEALCGRFEVLAEQRQIRFTRQLPQAALAEIDPGLLERAVMNLLSNAFKFTPDGGSVTLGLVLSGSQLRLEVGDSGPGIPAGEQERIFEPFRQAEQDERLQRGGTGLGLAIVKDVVTLHGGSIAVSSQPGQGAQFTLELPVQAPAGATVQAQQASHAPLPADEPALPVIAPREGDPVLPQIEGRASVLVVEDNAELRSFVGHTLSDQFNVSFAHDGRQGLELALQLRPDLVVTDLMMPHMDGEALVRELRRRVQMDALPVLLLSARADDEMRVHLLRAGAQDYLAKPFAPQELLARASTLVTMKRTRDALREELANAGGDLEALAQKLALKHRQLQTALDSSAVAREQAELASQAKGRFLAMMSHELRTPLSTIELNTALLLREQDASGAAAAGGAPGRAKLERIRRANDQMRDMVERVLEYTRFEGGELAPLPQALDLCMLAAQAVQERQDQAAPGVAVSTDCGVAVTLRSDPRLVRVALDQLLSNALKFTTRGTVTVRVGREGADALLEVRDTGVGMDAHTLQPLFEPFSSADLAHRHLPGLGLGLALVQHIATLLGGRVEADSRPGEGSRFALRLPDLETAGHPAAATATPA